MLFSAAVETLLEEEAHHFARGIRTPAVGVAFFGMTAGPRVSSTMYQPELCGFRSWHGGGRLCRHQRLLMSFRMCTLAPKRRRTAFDGRRGLGPALRVQNCPSAER